MSEHANTSDALQVPWEQSQRKHILTVKQCSVWNLQICMFNKGA